MKKTKFTKILYFGSIHFLLILTPLVFIPGHQIGYELAKTLILYLGTTLLLVNYFFSKPKAYPSKLKLLTLTFLILIIFTSLVGVNWGQSFWGSYFRKQGILSFSCYVIFFLLTSVALKNGVRKKAIARSIFISSMIAGLTILTEAVLYYLFNIDLPTYSGSRLVGTFSNPNLAAGFLAITLPFILFLIDIARSKQEKHIYKIGVFSTLYASILTFSKSGIIALVIVFVVYFYFQSRKKIQLAFSILAVAVLVVGVAFILKDSFLRYSLYENRTAIWQNALEAFVEKPIIGWGWENFDLAMEKVITRTDSSLYNFYVDRAHNEFLQIAVTTGFLGLIIYVLLIYQSLKLALKKLKTRMSKGDQWWLQAAITSLVGFLIFTQFNFFLTTGYLYFWFSLAIIDASVCSQARKGL